MNSSNTPPRLCTALLMEGVYVTHLYSYVWQSGRHLRCIWTLDVSSFILFGCSHEGVGIVAVQDAAVWCKEGHLHRKPGHEKVNCHHTAQLSRTLPSQTCLKCINHIKICKREASSPSQQSYSTHHTQCACHSMRHTHTIHTVEVLTGSHLSRCEQVSCGCQRLFR